MWLTASTGEANLRLLTLKVCNLCILHPFWFNGATSKLSEITKYTGSSISVCKQKTRHSSSQYPAHKAELDTRTQFGTKMIFCWEGFALLLSATYFAGGEIAMHGKTTSCSSQSGPQLEQTPTLCVRQPLMPPLKVKQITHTCCNKYTKDF